MGQVFFLTKVGLFAGCRHLFGWDFSKMLINSLHEKAVHFKENLASSRRLVSQGVAKNSARKKKKNSALAAHFLSFLRAVFYAAP